MARGLAERIQGTGAFLFGWADAPLQRGLAQRRKEMGWFKKKGPDLQDIRPDVGSQPIGRFGLTGESRLARSESRRRSGLIIVQTHNHRKMYVCPVTEHLQGLVQNFGQRGPNFQVSRVQFISGDSNRFQDSIQAGRPSLLSTCCCHCHCVKVKFCPCISSLALSLICVAVLWSG